jgi:hypothetical protein
MKRILLSLTVGIISTSIAWIYILRHAIVDGLIEKLDTIAARLSERRRNRQNLGNLGYSGQVRYHSMTAIRERRRQDSHTSKR